MTRREGEPPEEHRRVHRESFVLDLHTHGPRFVPQPFRTVWRGVTAGSPRPVGFDALRQGGVDAAVAKAVGDPVVTRWYVGRSPWEAVEAQLSQVERQASAAGAVVVGSVADVARARAAGTPAVLLGVEGADALGDDVDRVDAWYERGVRMVVLVHLGDNALGTTCLPWQSYAGPLPVRRRADPGLTSFGARAVRRMNDLGVLVDLAHCDQATLLDVVAVAGVIGPEHLALGTDMNGVPGVMAGFGGEADLPSVTGALLDAGFARTEVEGILGENALRVLRQVEGRARPA